MPKLTRDTKSGVPIRPQRNLPDCPEAPLRLLDIVPRLWLRRDTQLHLSLENWKLGAAGLGDAGARWVLVNLTTAIDGYIGSSLSSTAQMLNT